ncbi:MAG TPA: Lpg1974 family pore-forming outer membrane protein [Gemmatales bacterium]|nr:Lpg1974 family pore-forming outer membrane protein [Gemmatales bacterium]HMP57793.1 Lpg1974 family pore-forming outer membrane protein [Gemmatales bacterium]
MKKTIASALSAAALMWLGGTAMAQQPCHTAPVWQAPVHDLNSCDSCCSGGFYGSASALWLKPRWDNNLAFTTNTNFADGVNFASNVTSTQFSHDLQFQPRVIAGYESCDGIGGRVRWFRGWWSDSQVGIDPVGPPDGGSSSANPLGLAINSFGSAVAPAAISSASNLRLQTWDLEATKTAKIGGLDLTLAAGSRYLHMTQHYDMHIATPGGDVFVAQALVADHSQNLLGPTAAIEGRLALGGGLALYTAGRVSVLFGDGRQSATSIQYGADFGFGEPVTAQGSSVNRDTVMPVTELEIGAEFSTSMGSSQLFAQGGFVGQVYYGAGNSSRSGNFANESNSNLGLVGFAFTVGVRY